LSVLGPFHVEVKFLLFLEALDLVNVPSYQSLGFTQYIMKPFHVERLMNGLRKLLEDEDQPGLGNCGNSQYHMSRRLSTEALETQAKAIQGMRVLVTEDNLVNQLLVEKMLKKLGCKVFIAKDGFEALLLYESQELDLILMDLHMPNMDGFETTKRIRDLEATSGSLKRMPIVALTAKSMNSDRQNCLEANMDGYISKPHSMNDLRQALVRYSPRKNSQLSPDSLSGSH